MNTENKLILYKNKYTICSNSIDILLKSSKLVKIYINLDNNIYNLKRIANTNIIIVNDIKDIKLFLGDVNINEM